MGDSRARLCLGGVGGLEGCPGRATPKFQVLRQKACPAGTLDRGLPLALGSVGTLQKQKFSPRRKPDAKCLPYGKDKGQESRITKGPKSVGPDCLLGGLSGF